MEQEAVFLVPKQLQQQDLEQLLHHRLALVSLGILQLDQQVCLVALMPKRKVCFNCFGLRKHQIYLFFKYFITSIFIYCVSFGSV